MLTRGIWKSVYLASSAGCANFFLFSFSFSFFFLLFVFVFVFLLLFPLPFGIKLGLALEGYALHSAVKSAVIVGCARTDDGDNHRQGATPPSHEPTSFVTCCPALGAMLFSWMQLLMFTRRVDRVAAASVLCRKRTLLYVVLMRIGC